MYNLGEYVFDLTMMIAALWIVNKFLAVFYVKKKKNIWGIAGWGVFAVFQLVVELCKGNASIWTTIIGIILVYFIILGNYFWKGKNNLFIIILFYAIWAFVEMLVFYILSNFYILGKEANILGVLISKIIMFIGVNIFSVYWKRDSSGFVSLKYYSCLLFVPIGSIYIANNTFWAVKYSDDTFSAMMTFSILLLLNIIIFEIYYKVSENFLLEKEKDVYAQQLDIISKNMEEQKKVMERFHEERHNWINELIVLKNSVENSEKDEVIQNISKIIKVCDENIRVSDSGNNIIDAILNFKYAAAEKEKIDFNLKIFIPEILPFEQCDMGIILGNTIDNAIEAVKECHSHKKVIDIFMGIKKEALVLTVRNPYEHSLKTDKSGNFISTKEESHRHGYGVNSIKRVVEKYMGEVLIETQEDVFSITIIMNIE